jgi:type IV secretory pathway VirB10-like protein
VGREGHYCEVLRAGKEFYIVVMTGAEKERQNVVQGETIKKDTPRGALNEILPAGFMIRCAFVYGVDAQSQTPVSAIVTSDVWWMMCL